MSRLGQPGSPWADYLDARLRLVHQWNSDGRNSKDICDELNHHDVGQIDLLIATPDVEAPPCTTRRELSRMRCMFELLGVAKRYGERELTRDEMRAEIAAIVETLP